MNFSFLSKNGDRMSWIYTLTYIIISYLIGISGIKVYNLCEESDDQLEEKGGGKSTPSASLAFTSLFVIFLIPVMFIGKQSFNEGLFGTLLDCLFPEYSVFRNKKVTMIGIASAVVVIICGLLSIALTAASVFTSYDTLNACNSMLIQSEEERENFEHWSEMVISFRVIMILILIFIGLHVIGQVVSKVRGNSFGSRRIRKRKT